MDHISQVINRASSHPQNEPSRQDRPHCVETLPGNHPIWELWKRMGEMYGHSWASQQGDTPNDTWLRGLEGLTPEQYGAGLRACLKRVNAFPPTLPEFIAMATGHDDQAWERQCHRVIDNAGMLPRKRTEEETKAGLENIARLKSMLMQ